MQRAVIIGGTGAIGRATARRLLLAAGWSVTLTGRDPARMPRDIAASGGQFTAASGGQFTAADRQDAGRLRAVAGDGADLLPLNAAHPDAPSALEMSRVIARHLGYTWEEVLLEAEDGPPGLGRHPWDAPGWANWSRPACWTSCA